jgi:cytochrome c oxidase cbb3-type subunit III
MMTIGWSIFVAVLSVLNILGCAWLIWWTARARPNEVAAGEVTEHVWDGDLRERNNPMPRWWLILFFLTIGFAGLYLALYPGLGRFGGLLGWSKEAQYDQELALANRHLAHVYAAFAGRGVAELARDPRAVSLGHNLYENNCINCHGSDARGAVGFPNLTDNDWLYGGGPATIEQTIAQGREGVMPALGSALGDGGVDEVVAYVLSLSGRAAPADKVAAGKDRFVLCAACHGADGKGNQTLGAPNLTDQIWLYGGTPAEIRQSIVNGRHGQMPAWSWLGADRVRLLAAYIYSLSQGGAATDAPPTGQDTQPRAAP